jgi:diguanylate cyclase (GGDEF)-like protein/PAS domain S-box-containing protein
MAKKRKNEKSDISKLQMMDALMKYITDSIYFKDRNSRFVLINKAEAEKFGIKDPDEAVGKTDFDFFSEEHAKQAYDDEQNVIKTGRPIVDFEEKETYEDREDRWITSTKMPFYDEKGKIIGTFGISRDITDRKIVENKLEKEISFMNALMERIPDSIYFKDRNSRFVLINKAEAEKFGIKDPDEAVGKTDFDFFSEEHAKQAYDDEQNVIKTGRPIVDFEEKETYEDREDRWITSTKMPFYDEKGKIIGTFGISRDITDRKKAEEKIEYLSFHDGLTGLYNRAYFDEELNRLDTERQLPITIVMGDLNGLKLINDAYGHSKGDMLLRNIADILKESFRKEDITSRWGGDEFISILPKTSIKDAKSIIKRIKELCEEKSTTEMPLSISLGASTKKSSSEYIYDILKEAEDKMYKSKIVESTPVEESFIQSLRVVLKKGDYRTETRIKKMENYAVLIGKRLNLSSIKLEELKLLMNLHNIGKLALADEIMTKKGRLTAEEWKIIKEIPEIGYRIAESSTKLKSIAESIRTHHEWYNGQGYPRGIKGEEIPVLSRISFLINAYDAMTSDRPYRNKMTKEEAKKEIKKFSGIQFDPKVVDAFFELLEEGK